MHVLKSDECELEEHEKCLGRVFCEECAPEPKRPCNCSCHKATSLTRTDRGDRIGT